MSFTTVSLRIDVAKKLKAAKLKGESYSDTIERLLENETANTGADLLESLKPFEGRGVFTPEGRERLMQRHLPKLYAKRKRRAVA